MMSAFMFPIYLATKKIQKKERRIRGRTEGTTKTEKFGTKKGPQQAKTKQERGKAKAR